MEVKQANMMLNLHRNRRSYQGRGEGGKGVWRWRKREVIYLSLHSHHQNDSCIKMGSDESHFNVSLILRDKVKRQCPQTTIFEEEREPKRIRTEVLLLISLTPYRYAKPALITIHLFYTLFQDVRCLDTQMYHTKNLKTRESIVDRSSYQLFHGSTLWLAHKMHNK